MSTVAWKEYVSKALSLWDPLSWALLGLGLLGCAWVFTRWWFVEREHPQHLLQNRFQPLTRWLLQHRRSRKTLPVSIVMVVAGLGLTEAPRHREVLEWAFINPQAFLGIHAAAVLVACITWLFWDRTPPFVKAGEGRADAQFSDVPEEWGQSYVEGGEAKTDPHPVAEVLVYRSPTQLARRIVGDAPYFKGSLTLVSFRWDILSQHVLVFGSQGSGKTASLYAPLMLSARCPWIYQDSKAELPYLDLFPGMPVWGLDVRGHQTRSAVWNPAQEIRSSEDFDLTVDYVFPLNPKDPNPWVRDMARVIFGAVLRSRKWESIQEISRTLRKTRLEPFLNRLDPIFRDTMKEPKSQVPVLQDLVVTLSRWETLRVRTITEGASTVTLDDFIQRGGYVMNCEDSDALKVPVHLFWAMLLGRLRNRAEGYSRLLLLLDEFGDCGRIPNIQRALVMLRSKGAAIVAGIQNLGLLKDVYPTDWEAVLKGFGSRIWLTRNLEDDFRERLTKAIGTFTRRVPPASKHAKETEKESNLMPLDAWGAWSRNRIALGRLHGWTYWVPVPIRIPRTPLGALLPGGDPWADSEAEAKGAAEDALKAAGLPELQIPGMTAPPSPGGTGDGSAGPPATSTNEEDWL